MEPNDDQDLARLFPNIAAQLRGALGNIHYAAAALAPAEARERDPELDGRAALLDQSYYQLLRLINNLTEAAWLSSDRPLAVKNCDLVELMGELCGRAESLAALLGLKLTFSCAMASHVCAVNRDSFEQLFFQLLSNAFKFTPAGGTVTVELRAAGDRLRLSVSDTGCGIPEELLPTLFDRYLHAELMNPAPHGLGLGLPLCRRIAEGHGGSIMAESRVGQGTTVVFSFPDRRSEKDEVSDLPFDYAGGFNTTLLELADALPSKAFLLREQE